MKKATSIILKSLLGLVLLILILLFSVPLIFRDKIKEKVVNVINGSVEARLNFGDYKLGFFKNFPNLTFSLENLSVAGVGKFEGDTLATANSINLVFNLSSIFGKEGYEVKSVIIDGAGIKTLVLEDGSANWDIMTDSEEEEVEAEEAQEANGVHGIEAAAQPVDGIGADDRTAAGVTLLHSFWLSPTGHPCGASITGKCR